MAPPRRNFGDHGVVWSPSLNKFVITPRYPNSTITLQFGIGDALIRINTSNPPEKIVQPITGETTMEGLTPTSPFGLKRWWAMPHTIETKDFQVMGFRGWSHTLSIPVAGGGSVKQVTATDIIQNGYGSEEIVGTPLRLNF